MTRTYFLLFREEDEVDEPVVLLARKFFNVKRWPLWVRILLMKNENKNSRKIYNK